MQGGGPVHVPLSEGLAFFELPGLPSESTPPPPPVSFQLFFRKFKPATIFSSPASVSDRQHRPVIGGPRKSPAFQLSSVEPIGFLPASSAWPLSGGFGCFQTSPAATEKARAGRSCQLRTAAARRTSAWDSFAAQS